MVVYDEYVKNAGEHSGEAQDTEGKPEESDAKPEPEATNA